MVCASAVAVEVPGLTFSVASRIGGPTDAGDHFHSQQNSPFGIPPGKAEVSPGALAAEEIRGMSEFDLTGLGAGPAIVTFRVFNDGGMLPFGNDWPFQGSIQIVAYGGNNLEDLSDYQAPVSAMIASFPTSGLRLEDTLSFDITAPYQQALALGWDSLGVRLEVGSLSPVPTERNGAWTFDRFQLTVIPEPDYLPAAAGPVVLAGIFCVLRRRRR